MASNENNAPAVVAGDTPLVTGLPMAWVRVSHKSPDHIAARYPYAGYGSNLNLDQMTRRCPGADIVGGGLLRDARIVFAYHLGIVADKNATVQMGVFKVTAADVAALDRYEALGRNYERILVTVEVGGQAVRCFTYLKKDNVPEVPTDSYYATCLQGFNDWQFETRRLRHARDHARKYGRPQRAPRGKGKPADLSAMFPGVATYCGAEPIANGSAASYRPATRTPRPVGGRLGGAEYLARMDARTASVPSSGAAGATATGRDGTVWISALVNGHMIWKRKES